MASRIGFEVEYAKCCCLHFELLQEALRSRVAGHLLELMEQKARVSGFGEGLGNGPPKKGLTLNDLHLRTSSWDARSFFWFLRGIRVSLP